MGTVIKIPGTNFGDRAYRTMRTSRINISDSDILNGLLRAQSPASGSTYATMTFYKANQSDTDPVFNMFDSSLYDVTYSYMMKSIKSVLLPIPQNVVGIGGILSNIVCNTVSSGFFNGSVMFINSSYGAKVFSVTGDTKERVTFPSSDSSVINWSTIEEFEQRASNVAPSFCKRFKVLKSDNNLFTTINGTAIWSGHIIDYVMMKPNDVDYINIGWVIPNPTSINTEVISKNSYTFGMNKPMMYWIYE